MKIEKRWNKNRSLMHTSIAMSALFGMSLQAAAQDVAAVEEAPQPPTIDRQGSPGLKRQAGVGSQTAYAEGGVVEMGGFFNYSGANNVQELTVGPSLGYFFTDNGQVSGLVNWNYTTNDNQDIDVSTGNVIVEPSLHVPMNATNFVFGGLGVGALLSPEDDVGYALAPRLGYKHLVGRSGLINVTVQGLIGIDEANVQTAQGTVLTVDRAADVGLGYSVML